MATDEHSLHSEEPGDEPDITEFLRSWSEGDPRAAEQWLKCLYRELRRLAAHFLGTERSNHTLQPTALVHEAFLRLEGQGAFRWKSRVHFMRIAARMMRRILVDHARGRSRRKRGGELIRVDLSSAELSPQESTDVVLLHEAIESLRRQDERKAAIIELHFFGGFSVAETAEALTCSESTISRDWRMAKAWLARELK